MPLLRAAALAVLLALPAAAWAEDASGLDMPAAPPQAAVIGPLQPAAAGTLRLGGDGQQRAVTCTGRNVLIEASRSRFVLHGGCRSVTVEGDADTVEAEVLPGARLAIAGAGVTLRYTLMAAGPPLVVSVTGADSRVTAAPGGGTAIYTAPSQGEPIARVPH